MIYLVTGATGFLGSHLVDSLISQGHTVYSLARSSKKVKEFNVKGHIIYGDLSIESIKSWTLKLPEVIDTVIHTAGIVHSYNKEDFFKINTQSTIHLYDEITRRYSNGHFIFISSLAAAGPGEINSLPNESHKAVPVSSYGKSKHNAETSLLNNDRNGWRTNIIRPPMVIGPRDPAVLDIFKMVKSKLVLYPGIDAGKKKYSFVCVFDLVKSIIELSHSKELNKEVFYISYPETITYNLLIETIKHEYKSTIIILPIPFIFIKLISSILNSLNKVITMTARLTPDKTFELAPMNWTCDSSKSRNLLGLDYSWNLNETIKVTKDDYMNRDWI